MKTLGLVTMMLVLTISTAYAKVDLVTLPTRDKVQVTIYNSADLTLVRESRMLTLKQGANHLQFSWAGTLIDPTSLEMLAKSNADKIHITDLTYPPRVKDLGLWNIQSEMSGKVPVEITYLTSGLSWRAFYMGTLTQDEQTMRLTGYVRVTNSSGEDYENAQVRMIVGKIHLLDEIAALAQRQYPYGRPGPPVLPPPMAAPVMAMDRAEAKKAMVGAERREPKKIIKEGLSEYFLYTIEGSETIPDDWSKRLPSFEAAAVPVVNLYKYEEERYDRAVVRFLSFKNDKEHQLGETPIPGGRLKVYRSVDMAGHLSYEGQSDFKYIPMTEKVELNLGAVGNVVVEPTLMDYKTDNYLYDEKGDISGWDTVELFKVVVKNTRPLSVKVEITRNFAEPSWDIKNSGDYGQYEKVDLDTVKYTLSLSARSQKEFTYTLITHHGKRAE